MISAVILAAGKSERMQDCKQLLKIGGKPMIKSVVSSVLESNVDETVVVLGYRAREVADELPGGDIKTVVNPDFEEGMSTSLKSGLKKISADSNAVLIVLADQPLLETEVINHLINEYERTDHHIVAPIYKGQRGNPVLIDISLKSDLLKIRGDVGAREILENRKYEVLLVEVNTPSVMLDVNTAEDVKKVRDFRRRGPNE